VSDINDGDRIELRFPARGDFIVLARLVTSAISARAGFDIEQLEDLRLAVGELCVLTLGNGVTSGDLCLEFTVHDEAIAAVCKLERASSAGSSGTAPEEADESARLSELILDALVDEHGSERQDGSVRAWIRKRRGGHVG
jgi:serine/threonine-protein kinase RsbW